MLDALLYTDYLDFLAQLLELPTEQINLLNLILCPTCSVLKVGQLPNRV